MTPGELIRSRREALGLSIAEVARRSGIARERISKMENGHVGIGEKVAERLAPVLEVEVEDLLPPKLEPANLTTLLGRIDGQGGLLRQVATDVHRIRRDVDALLARLAEYEGDGHPRQADAPTPRTGSRRASSN